MTVTLSGTTLSTNLCRNKNSLLDLYPGAAAAYSLRKLKSDYTGAAIRVRRASDSAEQDIGFRGGILDTVSLTSFCTGTDGLVTTWYDQSGNAYDASQATTSNQPKIYDSATGIITNSNGNISILCARDALGIAGSTLLNASASIATIQTALLICQSTNFHSILGGTNFTFSNTSTVETWTIGGVAIPATISQSTTAVYLRRAKIDGSNSTIYRNGSQLNSGTFGTPGTFTNTAIFGGPGKYAYYTELILSENSSGLEMENEINTYWSIYL